MTRAQQNFQTSGCSVMAARAGANPRPARHANLLVEVAGRDLDAEDVIKMPLNLNPLQGTDWRATLTASLGRLNALQTEATAYGADRGAQGYIRPIMLVQVERTGKDQGDGQHIHADHVQDWLLASGLDEAEIAIKTAEQNDLNQPENLDLLSHQNRVRVIVTKAALQEGWDCPFAYVLCSLAAASNRSAMTQLVGRILRQPYALKTGVTALDECYVVTHHAATRNVVDAIKTGLGRDGLADLVIEVPQDDTAANSGVAHKIERRADRGGRHFADSVAALLRLVHLRQAGSSRPLSPAWASEGVRPSRAECGLSLL